MEALKNNDHFIHLESGLAPLNDILAAKNYSKVFVFADSTTKSGSSFQRLARNYGINKRFL